MAKKAPPKRIRLARAQKAKVEAFTVYSDAGRHTCLQVAEAGGPARFIPLAMEGLKVCRLDWGAFQKAWTPVAGYPPIKAARLFVGHACLVGATAEALDLLEKLVPIPKDLRKRADDRQTARADNLTKARAARTTNKKAAARK